MVENEEHKWNTGIQDRVVGVDDSTGGGVNAVNVNAAGGMFTMSTGLTRR